MTQITLYTSTVFDPKAKDFLEDILITVDTDTGLITRIQSRYASKTPIPEPLPPYDIDLRGKVVMPGFVDAHTHIFLHSYDEASATVQKRDESIPERIIRAVNHCRRALLAGYTTYRDLGTECMQDCDTNVRDAIARGLIPGPRLFVATRELASTGSFELRTENAMGGHVVPAGPDAVDGVDEVRAAVRRRIAAGADVIKFYADYRRRVMRFPPPQQTLPYAAGAVSNSSKDLNPDVVMFSQEEMDMIVKEARLAKCPVAAHACTIEGARGAVRAGVDTIEHAFVMEDELLVEMRKRGVVMVPTLAVAERLRKEKIGELLKQTKKAYDMGVRLACGGDTGTFNHGENAREMELMIESGIPVEDVLEACMVGGWKSCGSDRCGRRFGVLEEGAQADIIALDTDPRVDIGALRKVDFVMKDAKIWKVEGKAVDMI